jgi:hypothetical protein
MSAPTRSPEQGLSGREQLAVSSAALSGAPWKIAGAAGVVTTGGDLLLHLITGSLTVGGPLSLGAVVFFAVAAGGALVRARRGRAVRWARSNPWRFAVLPGAAAAVVVFVLSVLLGSGLPGGVFTAVWHGALAYGLTGAIGTLGSLRRRSAA